MNRWLCVKLIQSAGCLEIKQTWFQHVKIEVRYCPDALPTKMLCLSSAWQNGPGPMATLLLCHHQCPEVLLKGDTLGAEPPSLLCQYSGCSCTMESSTKWDALTFEHHVCISFFPYCHIFFPFGSGYSPHWLRQVGSIAFLVLTFTRQVYGGVRLTELIWRQWLVPRSHIYGRSAFPRTVNQRTPAQRWPKGHHSPPTWVGLKHHSLLPSTKGKGAL